MTGRPPGAVPTDLTTPTVGAPLRGRPARTLAPEAMTSPETIAAPASTLIALPNNAAVSELPVNCVLDPSY